MNTILFPVAYFKGICHGIDKYAHGPCGVEGNDLLFSLNWQSLTKALNKAHCCLKRTL